MVQQYAGLELSLVIRGAYHNTAAFEGRPVVPREISSLRVECRYLSVRYRSCGHIDVLDIWSSDIFFGSCSGFGSIIGLGIFYFGQVCLRFPYGIRVELYASGGASFSSTHYNTWYIISTLKVCTANITFFGIFGDIWVRGVCHRDEEWWTFGAIDCSSGAAAGGRSSICGWSIILYEYEVRVHQSPNFVHEYEVRVRQYLSTKYLLKDTSG